MLEFILSFIVLVLGIFLAIKLALWKAKKDHEEFIRPYNEWLSRK